MSRTPETNDALGCSSWALVSLREYNVAGLAEYACETYRRQCFNVEIMRETSICIVTENEESDVPDKRQHDGIGGEASVNVAIGGEISVNVAIGGGGISDCRCCWQQANVSADRRSQRIMQPGRSSEATQTSNLHENSGTVEYFAGQ